MSGKDHDDRAWVAGVDGCRGGWVVALAPLDPRSNSGLRCLTVGSFEHVLALPEQPRVIAVDIPVGLPDRAGPGGRACDRAARGVLGNRQSSLFAVPARAAVYAVDYASACASALRHSDPPRKVSKQCFNLFPKIREVDGMMTPALCSRVVECHPEVSFWAMNGERPLPEPKKVKSAPYEPGLRLREALLEGCGITIVSPEKAGPARVSAGRDDVLDAWACAWTARRIATGQARLFPQIAEYGHAGLRMQIAA
jgi:predicted RNase H-like nuclease